MCVLWLCVIFCLSVTANAHSTSQSGIIDEGFLSSYTGLNYESNYIWWSIDEAYHNGNVNLTYKFDTGLSLDTQELFEDGAALWSNNTSANITYFSSSTGIVSEANIWWNTDLIAFFGNYEVDASGHLTKWAICVNTAADPAATAVDLAHEIGHAFGLNDLYYPVHISCLMYGHTSCTATAPTSSDIKGFKLITGLHTRHIWMYTNTRKTCYICSGVKTESHNYVCSDYGSISQRCLLCLQSDCI